ncbi:MAG TPA: T9SS type A sorting domain-containing protein, partial [Chitinophagales bacterium]|nr:T9SS type A sorting domain-containing protein [Chitinophagales bacterium]
VAGRAFNGSNQDMLFIKYNSAGAQQWVKVIDGGFGDDEIRALIIDNNENIYATGISAGATDSADFITMKYSPAGDQLWLNRYNGAGSGGDFGTALSLDPGGNIFVTGFSDGDNTAAVNFDLVTFKYDTNGTELWKKIENGAASLDDIADALVADQFGNVYVAGHTNTGTAGDVNYDLVTIRYNADGTEAWKTFYNGIADTLDEANMLWLSGNDLFVAGSSWQTGQQRDMLVIKYSSVTGIEGSELTGKQQVTIYPDPFSNYITVQVAEIKNQELKFELRDMTGRLIFSEMLTGISTIYTPVNLSSGMYMYSVINDSSILQTGKLIHQ